MLINPVTIRISKHKIEIAIEALRFAEDAARSRLASRRRMSEATREDLEIQADRFGRTADTLVYAVQTATD